MDCYGNSPGKWIILLLILGLFFSAQSGFAQLEDLDELDSETEDVKCQPDSLTTIYDKFKSDSLGKQQIGIWYSLAREEFKYQNYKRAIPYYWKVLVNDTTGKFKVVYSKLATCYYSLKEPYKPEPDSVLLVVNRGLQKYPDNTQLHYWGGLVHDRLGHTECTIVHYEALAAAEPNNKDYWSKLAFLYYKLDDCKAVQAQQKVVELDPADVEASRLLADIMEHCGEDPIKAVLDAFKNDTTNIDNSMRYGKMAFERGNYKEALRPFNCVIIQDQKHTVALEYLGRCYEGISQLSKALGYYKDILQIEPANVNVMCLTASVYGRLNQFTTGRNYVYKALRVDRGNGLPHMVMGEIFENSVQYCSDQRENRKLAYDDKLVYMFAQQEYDKAASDPNYTSSAKRRSSQLKTLVPTTEDFFMNKNRKKTKDSCYDWTNK